jgi:hypothetical protein
VDNLPGAAVVLRTADSHQVVPFERIVQSSRGPGMPPDTFTGEDAFATALTKLTESEKATVYALAGHGERPLEAEEDQPALPGAVPGAGITSSAAFSLSRAVRELAKDNYEVKPLNLAVAGAVPDDCAALLIAGPRAPLSESELRAIESYLDERSGGLIVMVDSELLPEVRTNVEELLARYGVTARTDTLGFSIMHDLFRGPVSYGVVPVEAAGLADHPVTADLESYRLWFERPCTLEVHGRVEGRELVARSLLTGIESSWGETEVDAEGSSGMEYDPLRDGARPAVVGAVVQPARGPAAGLAGEADLPGPKLVVFAASVAFTNARVEQSPANLYLLANAVNWMAGRAHMLGIPPKDVEFHTVPVSEARIRAARYLFIGVVPACAVALGIVVWIMRRR